VAARGIAIPFLVLFITLSVWSGPFLSKTNLINILDQQSAILAIAAAGTLVLVAGGLDLSVGAIYGLATVVSEKSPNIIPRGSPSPPRFSWDSASVWSTNDRGLLKDQSAHRDIGNVICHKWGRAEGVQWQPHRALPKLCVL